MDLNSVNAEKLPGFHLPEPIVGPQAWYGPDLRIANDWIHHFSKEDIREIEAAFKPLVGSAANIVQISKSDFRLPNLSNRLQSIDEEVMKGRGIAFLR